MVRTSDHDTFLDYGIERAIDPFNVCKRWHGNRPRLRHTVHKAIGPLQPIISQQNLISSLFIFILPLIAIVIFIPQTLSQYTDNSFKYPNNWQPGSIVPQANRNSGQCKYSQELMILDYRFTNQ